MRFRSLGLSAPSGVELNKLAINEFKGIDKASGEDNFSPARAVSMQNFIRDKIGGVKKRGGFKKIENGLGKDLVWIDFWKDHIVYYDGSIVDAIDSKRMNVPISKALTVGPENAEKAVGFGTDDYYYVLCKEDGHYRIYRYGDNGSGEYAWWGREDLIINEPPRQQSATAIRIIPLEGGVPRIIENSNPRGGGNLIQSVNLLSPLVTETFSVSKNDYDYPSTPDRCARFQLLSRNITLTYNKRVISSSEWMSGKSESGEVYWKTDDNGIRKLTALGESVLQRSIKIERYMIDPDVQNEADKAYVWRDITTKCFANEHEGFVNTEFGALWIPAVDITEAPVENEPNVRVTYIRNQEEFNAGFERLLSCTMATSFGVGGYKDRIFLAGGNKIYYSGMDEALYFGELCYVEPCSEDKQIDAMGGEGKTLYAVDSDGITHAISGVVTEDDSSTFINDAAFVIADRVQGEKPIGSVLKIFGGEFCYLSEEGVVAIRHDNFYDKRYAQNRSRMIGNELKGKIVGATVWGNFLVIATDDQLYFLDELQQTRLEDYKYSGVQYEIFPFAFDKEALGEFSIKRIWTENDQLHLQILKDEEYRELIYDETALQDNFGDGAVNIYAEWITPPFSLSDIHRKKRVQECYLEVGAEHDAVKVEYCTDNQSQWRTLREPDGRFIPFDYGKLDYGLFNYNPQVSKLHMSVRGRPSRPFYKIQFRFSSKEQHNLSLSSFGFYYKKEVI